MNVGNHEVGVEFGMDVLEDIHVAIICQGISGGPLLGIVMADCVDDIHLLKDVMNVAICALSPGYSSALEIHEVCDQLGSQAPQCEWIVPVTLGPVYNITFG